LTCSSGFASVAARRSTAAPRLKSASRTVERAKENDPKALKLELAKLRQQLASRPKEQVEKIVEKIVERPAIDAKTLKETEGIVERLEREGAKQIEAGNRLVEAAKLMAAALRATARIQAA
jgi:hypothetical protein